MDYELNELHNLAQVIQDGFFRRKEVQLNKRYKPHPKYLEKALWLKAAGICKNLNADPSDFIEAAFMFAIRPIGAPFPQMLTGQAIERWYKNYMNNELSDSTDGKTKREQLVEQEMRTALHICNLREKRLGKSFRETLLDPIIKFSPYIRLLLLKDEIEAWARYAEEVKSTIKISPGLDKILEQKGLEISKLYE